MGKVTSKLQVTVPKTIADRFHIRPGDDLDWVPAADSIHVVPGGARRSTTDVATRLRLFDRATERQQARQASSGARAPRTRGWRREDLYQRGRAR